jgi:Family of unknown function (DUF6496)
MPDHPPHTKAEKQAAVHQVMHEFKHGSLHSGSPSGPKVKSREQAVAIAMSESGQSRKGHGQMNDKRGEGMPAGQPKDPTHHSEGYSHLRHQTGFDRSETPSVRQKGVSMEESRRRGTTGSSEHSDLRLKGNFHEGTKAEATDHVGDGHTSYGDKAAGHTGLEAHDHPGGVRAEHHPPTEGEPHRFSRPPATPTSGFGHAAHQRSGHLRMSGHPGGHRIGAKKK